ncbi:cell adhesion molecule CEACAM6-like [Macrotis lagotis]|uniref:cell adhesion molecule CEACAM6-like n=1 Tax=Macrotis lagotis TaxID=92651 RepID=UPI003D690842
MGSTPSEIPSEAPHNWVSPWKRFLITASILSSCIHPTSAQNDSITVVPSPPYGTVGSSVILHIQGFSGEPLSFNWYRKTTAPSNWIVRYSILLKRQTPAAKRERVFPNGSLLIPNLFLNDTDDYIVQILEFESVTPIIARRHLIVYGKCWISHGPGRYARTGHSLSGKALGQLAKPVIKVSGSNIIENDSLALTCSMKNEGINILWFSNDQPLLLNERMNILKNNQTLFLKHVKREDAGSYQCKIQNPISTNRSDPFILTINYGPDHIKILPSTKSGEVMVQLNDSLILECQTQSFPPAQYEWHVNDTIQSGKIYIITTSYWNHSGRYTCWAMNNVTKLSISKDIIIKVVERGTGFSYSEGVIIGLVIGILAGVVLIGTFIYFFVH